MNSQALQKRIMDGKLFSNGSMGEWHRNELRDSQSRGMAHGPSAVDMDAQSAEFVSPYTPAQSRKGKGNGSRARAK
jgi:hypothetical protein